MFFEVAVTATTLRALTVITVDRDPRTLFLAFIQSTYRIIRPNINIAGGGGNLAALADHAGRRGATWRLCEHQRVRRVFKGHFGMTPGQYIERFRVEP